MEQALRILAVLLLAGAAWLVVVPYSSTGLAAGEPVNCGGAFFTMNDRVGGRQREAGCPATSRVRVQQGLVAGATGGALLVLFRWRDPVGANRPTRRPTSRPE